MKKIIALLLALVMVVALASTGLAFADDAKTVGISMPTKSLERWNRDGSYLQEQFEAAGYKVLLTYSDNDAVQQNNDIANMIADGVEVLIIAAIDSDTLSSVLADAAEAGIVTIAYDRLINNAKTAYYVSFDNYTVGVLQAQYVIDALDLENAGDKVFNIEFTAGDPADTNAAYFFNGAFDTLKPYLDSGVLNVGSGQTEFEQVATPAWSTESALNRFQNILASYYADGTVLDIALCSNDSTALGVAQAITSDYAGDNAPIVTGQDGDIANLKNIVDGVQTMTVYKNVSDEAGVTLVVVKEILAGNTPDASTCSKFAADAAFNTDTYDNGLGFVPSFLLVPYSIDKDNLDLLIATGLYEMGPDGYLAAAS
jgi:putative multiple sugar transport system substrate-binding protein